VSNELKNQCRVLIRGKIELTPFYLSLTHRVAGAKPAGSIQELRESGVFGFNVFDVGF